MKLFLPWSSLAVACALAVAGLASLDSSPFGTTVSASASDSSVVSSQPIDLSITSADVAGKAAALKSTAQQLEQVERDISSSKLALASATERQSTLNTQINEMRARIVELPRQIALAEEKYVSCKQAHAAHFVGVESRKAAIQESTTRAVNQRYGESVAQIKLARKQRNDLRAKLGARPEDQSEVELELIRTRQARQYAEQSLDTTLRDEFSRIDAQTELFTARCAAAASQLASLRDERQSIEQLTSLRHQELSALDKAVASLPAKISQLRSDQDRLVLQKTEQSVALRATEAALQSKNDFLAQQESLKESRQRAVSKILELPPPSTGQYARTTTNAGKSYAYPSTSVHSSRATGRYYDYTYRPHVGDHYVRSYSRRDGTHVTGHRRTDADDSFWNNWSSRGNINPYTAQIGSKRPSRSSVKGATYVNGYFRSNGTYVSGHFRRK